MSLTQNQKRHLRGLGQLLKPIVHVGRDEVTDGLVAELDRALNKDELVKVKSGSKDRERRKREFTELANRTGSEIVSQVGGTVCLFRRNEKPEHWSVALPAN